MSTNQAFVFISEAAKLSGVSRRTIDRDIKAGKIHQTQIRTEKGRKKVSVAELEKVYGTLKSPEKKTQTASKTKQDKSPSMSQTEKDLVQHYKEELERVRKELEYERQRSGQWEGRFLAANEKLNGFLLPPPKEKKKGVFARMFGKN
jgi:DNA-binding transcriptional MerR regulator